METLEEETHEINGLEYTVRDDGDVKVTNPDTQNTLYIAKRELEHFLAEIQRDNAEGFDEVNELYGYAILNVHKGCFVGIGEFSESPKSYHSEENVVNSLDEVVNAFHGVIEREGLDDYSHLRVVSVKLDNYADKQAYKNVEEVVGQ